MISNNEFDDWGQQSAPDDANPEATGGVDLMQVAMRRKGLIALGIFIGLCLGLLYYARATPVYESLALLSIRSSTPPMATEFGQAFQMTTAAEDHAIRIKTSRILSDALEMDDGELKQLASLAGEESQVITVNEGLQIQPVQDGSEVLSLSYRGSSPEDTRMILENVMFSYRSFLDDGKRNVGQDMRKWITEAKDTLETRRLKQREDLNTWKQNHSYLFTMADDGSTNLSQQRLLKVEEARAETSSRLGEIQDELTVIAKYVAEGKDPRAVINSVAVLPSRDESYTDRLIDVEKFRSDNQQQQRSEDRVVPLLMQDLQLSQRFGPEHPLRQALQEQLKVANEAYQRDAKHLDEFEVQDKIKSAQERLDLMVETLRIEKDKLTQTLARLNRDFETERKKAETIAKDMAVYQSLVEDLERTDTTFNEVVKKVADIDLLKAYGDGDDEVDILQLPGDGLKVAPSLAKSLAAGTMLGFLAGFGLGYLVEMFDKTFRSPQEVSKVLQLPMIGHIPEITCQKPEESVLAEVLVTAHKPKSPLAENFRAIRTALYFSAGGQQMNVIQTTSPVPGDGKSTLTANIAITIAQSNKSILLVDADFRRPTQHKLFGLDNEIGLSSVVTGEADPDSATQSTEVPNLYLMSCGPRPHNPSELLTSPQFADLVEQLREQYDFVLIDTPPVLAVTDPGIVSARVDGVIMALRIRKNGRPSAVRARKVLHDLDANMLGIVVNGIDHRSGSYGYYSSYRRGYGYNYAYKYGYGASQDKTEKAINKYFEEPKEEVAK